MRVRSLLPFVISCAFLLAVQSAFADRAKISDFPTSGSTPQTQATRNAPDPANFPLSDETTDETTKLCTENPIVGSPEVEDFVVLRRENLDRYYDTPRTRETSNPPVYPPNYPPQYPPHYPPYTPPDDPPDDPLTPEPATLLICGLGCVGLLPFSRRFGNRK